MKRELGFALVSLRVPGTTATRTVARFACTSCPSITDVTVTSGQPMDAEGWAKKVNAQGWQARPYHKARTLCPRCATARPANDPDSELRKVTPMATPPAPKVAAPVAVREPTQDQRVRIRSYLDKHFDDAAGLYLDEMSDQRIAEAVDVPRIVVERMREAAYGPIRVDPAVVGLRAELAQLARGIEHQDTALAALKRQAGEISARLAKLASGRSA